MRAAGQARWFKVPILPNSRVDVSLSNLPADYDLIVFSDIQQAYKRLVGANVDPPVGPNLAIDDLQRAGAETPDDVFNTSQYDPSTWDPTNWDPTLNKAVFSPSQWRRRSGRRRSGAPRVVPSEWSPSEWSPSEWSPSEWSPSEWSPSEWSASQWSPSEWSSSNPADPRAFSAAQTASLLAVSAGPGTGDESVAVNTWNNTGHFYIRVQGKNGAFDSDNAFSLSVARQGTPARASSTRRARRPRRPASAPPRRSSSPTAGGCNLSTLTGRLNTLMATVRRAGPRSSNVDADLTVRSLNAQADLQASCPFAKNLVARRSSASSTRTGAHTRRSSTSS